jgi:transposase
MLHLALLISWSIQPLSYKRAFSYSNLLEIVVYCTARVRKPRDKAKVETGVQIVERNILAPLRNRTFFSIQEANEAIWELLIDLNSRPFQQLPGSRKSVFDELEKSVLQPLPVQPYVLANWKKAKVNIDYHVQVDGHYYSVPYRYAREQVEIRLTQNTIEVFHNGSRIAAHRRLPDLLQHRGRRSTVAEHMPRSHQKHLEWTPQRLIHWA